MRTITIVYLFISLTWSCADTQEEYAGAFLEAAVGARQSGMGGAGGIFVTDASAPFWNPAGLALLDSRNVQLMHNWVYGNAAAIDYAGFSMQLKGNASFGINVVRLGIDNIPEFRDSLESLYREFNLPPNPVELTTINKLGSPDGFLSYYDAALLLSFSKKIHFNVDFGWQYFVLPVDIPWGVTVKVIRSKLQKYGSASGIGLDAGGIVRIDGKDLSDGKYIGIVSFGISIQDITNTQITWSSGHKENIFYNIKLSSGYQQPLDKLKSKLTFIYDYNTKYDDVYYGMELNFDKFAALRSGINRGALSFGAGFYLWNVNVDYAIGLHELGLNHKLTSGYIF